MLLVQSSSEEDIPALKISKHVRGAQKGTAPATHVRSENGDNVSHDTAVHNETLMEKAIAAIERGQHTEVSLPTHQLATGMRRWG